jgi:hypothetical protein
MDNYSSKSTPIGQKLEIYTELFVINGLLTITSGRTSDTLNRSNTDFVTLHEATITPIGLTPNPKPLDSPVMVRRGLMNFLVEISQNKPPAQPTIKGASGGLAGREAYVHKSNNPCYAITGPFAIFGQCYLHQGTTLENLLQGVDTFFPITKATIYVLNHPEITWQRDLVIMNKGLLIAMYLLPTTA